MRRIKNWWLQSSIKNKLLYLSIVLVFIVLVSESFTMFLSIQSLNDLENIMNNNSVYQELQEAIKQEQEHFLVYMRNRTDENRIAYEDSCQHAKECIEALPFEYSELGEERYARTWNVISGYSGYIKYRDRLVDMSEEEEGYIDALYEVLDMQESLSNYASKLVQVTMNSWNQMYQEKLRLLNFIPILICTAVLFLMMIFLINWKLISRSMIMPLQMIAEDSREMAAKRIVTPPLTVENQDEIGDLVCAFNLMKDATQMYIHTLEENNRISERLHKEELTKIELESKVEQAQLEVLRQQVNPHFLFNSLNMISSMAKIEDAVITDRMILSLSNLFRYNLRTVEQEVYLEQEIDVLDDYIYIQQMRFDNRIAYEKNIEVNVKEVRIPSFTLQPIVENAFIHGVSSMEEGGVIKLHIRIVGNCAVIDITDNGCGMDEQTLAALNEKIHRENTGRIGIGLGNICRRIDMMYKDGSMTIRSTKDKGTTVTLVIPQNS